MKALVFDVDGTLAETEDIHRQAFNAAFEQLGLGWHWDVELNRELLAYSGGIERMFAYQQRLPHSERFNPEALADIHKVKRRIYGEMLAEGWLKPRPGVPELLLAARRSGRILAVATASTRHSLEATMKGCFGLSPGELFDVIVTGDEVRRKKPDPESYLLVLRRLGLQTDEVLVFEDSPVGCLAARAAGLRVVVTPSRYGPRDADYSGAMVLASLEPHTWPLFGFDPETAPSP